MYNNIVLELGDGKDKKTRFFHKNLAFTNQIFLYKPNINKINLVYIFNFNYCHFNHHLYHHFYINSLYH